MHQLRAAQLEQSGASWQLWRVSEEWGQCCDSSTLYVNKVAQQVGQAEAATTRFEVGKPVAPPGLPWSLADLNRNEPQADSAINVICRSIGCCAVASD